MLDFNSALYLGMRHPSLTLRPWTQLTTGTPAALGTPVGYLRLAQALADLVGCEEATLGPSTLHLFWDLFGILANDRVVIYLDAGAYPIARWGAERAAARRAPIRVFPHHDPEALDRWVKRDAFQRRRPVVVADGFCPGCGAAAPLPAYQAKVRAYGGYLIIDDTQALGIFGHSCGCGEPPYGKGGGGSLRWSNVSGPDIVVISSLAKGFGVPLAMLGGNSALIRHFEAHSETRVHSSPPSTVAVNAAEHAVAVNTVRGDSLRSHLAQLVCHFKKRLAALGLATSGGLFPVQTLKPMPERDARLVHQRLIDLGVRTVLQRPRCQRGATSSFLITALHRFAHIERAVRALAKAIDRANASTRKPVEMRYERFEFGFRTL